MEGDSAKEETEVVSVSVAQSWASPVKEGCRKPIGFVLYWFAIILYVLWLGSQNGKHKHKKKFIVYFEFFVMFRN